MTLIATTLYTYAEAGRVRNVAVRHYGREALFIRGYTGPVFSVGAELRALVAQGGRDMRATA